MPASTKSTGKVTSPGGVGGQAHSTAVQIAGKTQMKHNKPAFLDKPIAGEEQEDYEKVSTANDDFKIFTVQTGLSESEPSILLMSEFLPLEKFDKSKKSIDELLNIKEKAKLITAKSAITVLSQNKQVKSLIEANIKDIKSFVDAEKTFIDELLKKLFRVMALLAGNKDLLSYTAKASESNKFGVTSKTKNYSTFLEYLVSKGYDKNKVKKFSMTKLWLQAVMELKMDFMYNSFRLTGNSIENRKQYMEDNDPYLLADAMKDIKNSIEASKNKSSNGIIKDTNDKRYLISNVFGSPGTKIRAKTDEWLGLLTESNFVTSLISGRVDTGEGVFLESELQKALRYFSASMFMDEGAEFWPKSDEIYTSDAAKQFAVIADVLGREISYSYILGTEADKLNQYGFAISADGRNTAVHDYLFGRFPVSDNGELTSLSVVENPTGNNRSLVSYAGEIVPITTNPAETYKVLTFENKYIEEASNVTPGSVFYIDSTLGTSNSTTFDTSRLDLLIKKSNYATETLQLLEKFAKQVSPFNANVMCSVDVINEISKAFYPVRALYRAGIGNEENPDLTYDDIKEDNKIPLQFFYAKMFDKGAAYIDMRNSAIIAKTAYVKKDHQLLAFMFSLIMTKVLSTVETVSQKADFIEAETQSAVAKIYDKKTGLLETLDSSYVWNPTEILVYRSQKRIIKEEAYRDAVNPDKGVWKILRELLKNLHAKMEVASAADKANTIYSGQNKILLCYVYYFFAIKILSHYVPEKVNMTRSVKLVEQNNENIEFGTVAGIEWDSSLGAYQNTARPKTIEEFLNEQYATAKKNYNKLIKEINALIAEAGAAEDSAVAESIRKEYEITLNNAEDALKLADTQLQFLKTYSGYSSVTEEGLEIETINFEELKNAYMIGRTPAGYNPSLGKLQQAIALLKDDNSELLDAHFIFQRKATELNAAVKDFSNYLKNNIAKYLEPAKAILQTDEELSDAQRKSLLNMSMQQEQMLLNRYVASEIGDRLNGFNSSAAKLMKYPSFADFPDEFEKYLPINDIEMLSYEHLSPFYKSQEFQAVKGNNKKIISVGIPQKMLRTLTDSPNSPITDDYVKNNVVRLKLFKLDKLHPGIFYKPQSYLFELNRFPTRILNNWDLSVLTEDISNLLLIPTKYYVNYKFEVHKNFADAYDGAYAEKYKTFLTQKELLGMYANHAKSFLAEEYIRWFTGCHIGETRYHRYGGLKNSAEFATAQYSNFLSSVKQIAPGTQPTLGTTVIGKYVDPVDGVEYEIPISNTSKAKNQSDKKAEKTKKLLNLDLTANMKSYLLNETFLMPANSIKQQLIYPKKFDRTFNIIFDPDDFFIDQNLMSQESIVKFVKSGILTAVPSTKGKIKNYRHRDTGPGDAAVEEYFVTVETYDYNGAI